MMDDALAANSLVTLLACYVGVLVGLVVLSVIFMVVSLSLTSTEQVDRMLGRRDALRGPGRPLCSIPSKDVDFGRMAFECSSATRAPILSSVGLSVGSNRAVNVVKKAKDSGSSLMGLVDHLCSASANSMVIKNRSIHRCSVSALEGGMTIILRRGILFSNAVLRGLH